MAVFCNVVVLLAVVIFFAASTDSARQIAASSWLSYWQQKLPSVLVPKNMPQLASPLTASQTSAYVQLLQSGSVKLADGQRLCQESNMLCEEKATSVYTGPTGTRVCVAPYFYEYAGPKCAGHFSASNAITTGVFFDQASLVNGNKITYPKLTNSLSGRTFLPANLAKAMPFSKDRLSDEYVTLNVASDSPMAQAMQNTLSFCESTPPRDEIRTCHSTIESIVDFAVSNMGSELIVYTPEYSSSESQEVTIHSNPVTLSGPEQSAMTCHDLMYPYLVYGCHVMGSSQILNVKLETGQGTTFNAVAVCHTDTSTWNADHPAFAALGVKPGESHVCHWVPENNFVWMHAK